VDYETGTLWREQGWPDLPLRRLDLTMDPEPSSEPYQYRVEYSAGFLMAKDSGSTWDGTTATGRTLPHDLEDAAISLVRSMWLARERDPSVQSERVGDLSVTYVTPSQTVVAGQAMRRGLPAEVADLADPYRRLA
jgi:hypothetical protein